MHCSHYVPLYCGHNLDLSICKKYGRHADMCRMDEGKCGNDARHFAPKNASDISMELDCM
jgi:hypothetical protein